MPDPLFESRTPRLELPLLFAGQSQKEGFVNELAARLDAAVHGAIEAELAVPPAAPLDGQCWLVTAGASGDWLGQAGKVAARQAGNWLFLSPRDGMKLLNRTSGQEIRFSNGWKAALRPAAVAGGTTVDAEARAAIAVLVEVLTTAGIIPPS